MSGRLRPGLVAAASVLAVVLALGIALLRGTDHAATLGERVDAVAAGLRCPVCQDLSIADSPSSVAAAFRAEIARRLRDGQTPAEVRGYFVSKYGQWILLSPRPAGLNLLPWGAPLIALAIGACAVGIVVRRKRDAAPDPVTPADRARIARELSMVDESP